MLILYFSICVFLVFMKYSHCQWVCRADELLQEPEVGRGYSFVRQTSGIFSPID